MNKFLKLLTLACFSMYVTSCSDEMSSTYSKANYVYCYFDILQYNQLFHVMGNPGQFASIRKRVVDGVTKIEMSSSIGTTAYTADAINNHFGFGLGGLIVGTRYDGEPIAYDLACPNCNQAGKRLSMRENCIASCPSCKTTYDMNNYGFILTVAESNTASLRGLLRYRISYNGTILNVFN